VYVQRDVITKISLTIKRTRVILFTLSLLSCYTAGHGHSKVERQNLTQMKEWHKYTQRREGTWTRFRFNFLTITLHKIHDVLTCIIKSIRTYLAIIEATAAPFWLRLVVGYRRFGRVCRSHRLRLLDS